jgi:hypothetical protein
MHYHYRRRPIQTVSTRPSLMSVHIVVLPRPTTLQAVFTETVNGLALSGTSQEMPLVWILIARAAYRLGELCRVATDTSDCQRVLVGVAICRLPPFVEN